MNLIEHMSETIEDFRNFFKNKKDQISFDAPKTVMHTLRIIEPQLKSNNIKYKLGCQCDQRSFECNNSINLNTPECHYLVKGVPNEFKHVILNLIQNSKEALEKCDKERTISIVMSSCKNKIYIDVQDNGLGIPEDILENIFDPYVTAKENGTGMGLYMSKTIIEANMGGKLSAENNNIGALFKIELPVI
jgi:signal transduction histidine kinase